MEGWLMGIKVKKSSGPDDNPDSACPEEGTALYLDMSYTEALENYKLVPLKERWFIVCVTTYTAKQKYQKIPYIVRYLP